MVATSFPPKQVCTLWSIVRHAEPLTNEAGSIQDSKFNYLNFKLKWNTHGWPWRWLRWELAGWPWVCSRKQPRMRVFGPGPLSCWTTLAGSRPAKKKHVNTQNLRSKSIEIEWNFWSHSVYWLIMLLCLIHLMGFSVCLHIIKKLKGTVLIFLNLRSIISSSVIYLLPMLTLTHSSTRLLTKFLIIVCCHRSQTLVKNSFPARDQTRAPSLCTSSKLFALKKKRSPDTKDTIIRFANNSSSNSPAKGFPRKPRAVHSQCRRNIL